MPPCSSTTFPACHNLLEDWPHPPQVSDVGGLRRSLIIYILMCFQGMLMLLVQESGLRKHCRPHGFSAYCEIVHNPTISLSHKHSLHAGGKTISTKISTPIQGKSCPVFSCLCLVQGGLPRPALSPLISSPLSNFMCTPY